MILTSEFSIGKTNPILRLKDKDSLCLTFVSITVECGHHDEPVGWKEIGEAEFAIRIDCDRANILAAHVEGDRVTTKKRVGSWWKAWLQTELTERPEPVSPERHRNVCAIACKEDSGCID